MQINDILKNQTDLYGVVIKQRERQDKRSGKIRKA